MRRFFKRMLIVVLVVSLALGQIAISGATTTYRVDHMATATMIAAGLAITAAAEYAIAACAAYCASVWASITLASAATAEMLAIGLFYGSVVGLGAVAAYMLYKGLQYVDGVLYQAGATTYTVTPGYTTGVGYVGQCFQWTAVYRVNGVCGPTCSTGSCVGLNIGMTSMCGWGSPWSLLSADGAIAMACTGDGAHVTTQENQSPASIADQNATIQADLAGTNGQEAQDKALKAAADAISAYGGVAFDQAVANIDAVDRGKAPPYAWPLGIPEAGWRRIRDLVRDAITDATKAKLDAYEKTKNDVAYSSNPTTANMTKTDVRDAVRDGVKEGVSSIERALKNIETKTTTAPAEFAGSVPTVAAGDIINPQKGNLTTVLGTFWSGLGSVGPSSVLGNLSLTASGTSIFCIGMPMGLGDSCVDYGQYETTISAIGVLMKTIVSISWIIWIFM